MGIGQFPPIGAIILGLVAGLGVVLSATWFVLWQALAPWAVAVAAGILIGGIGSLILAGIYGTSDPRYREGYLIGLLLATATFVAGVLGGGERSGTSSTRSDIGSVE